MNTAWDGTERRVGFSEILISLAELRKDVCHVRECLDRHLITFSTHLEEDRKTSKEIQKISLMTNLLWIIFGLATFSVIGQDLVDAFFKKAINGP